MNNSDGVPKHSAKMKWKRAHRYSFKRSGSTGRSSTTVRARRARVVGEEMTSSSNHITSPCLLNPIHEVSWSELSLIHSQYTFQEDSLDEFPFDTATASLPHVHTLE